MTATGAIRQLLAERGPGKTICPSEAARLLACDGEDWRGRMDDVHAAARQLAQEGDIRLSWKGEPKTAPQGPYRIAQAR